MNRKYMRQILKIIGFGMFLYSGIQIKAQKIARIPIEFAQLGGGKCIVAKGLELNGKKLNLIFDTGGSGSGIDQQTITELNLKPDSTITARGNGGEMQVPIFADKEFKKEDFKLPLDLLLFPLPPAILNDGSKTNGLLGLGSLNNYYVEVNFDEMILTISEKPIMVNNESYKLKTWSDRGIRFFDGNLLTRDGKTITGPMYFDTGNTSSPLVINQKNILDYNFLVEKDKFGKVSLGGIGPSKRDAYKVQLPGFKLGDILIKDIAVLVTDTDGFSLREDIAKIGLNMIKKFNIIFDKSGEFVILSKSKFFNEPIKIIEKKEYNTSTEDLFDAIRDGNLEKVKSIWKTNINLSKVIVMSPHGNTALQTAILAEQTEIAKFLIEQKADLNAQNSGNGATALHLAIYKRNIELVRLLVAAGADKTIKDSRGSTPLQMAEMLRVSDVIEILK